MREWIGGVLEKDTFELINQRLDTLMNMLLTLHMERRKEEKE